VGGGGGVLRCMTLEDFFAPVTPGFVQSQKLSGKEGLWLSGIKVVQRYQAASLSTAFRDWDIMEIFPSLEEREP